MPFMLSIKENTKQGLFSHNRKLLLCEWHCLVQVGRARQCYNCSKNIYLVWSRNTMSIEMKLLLLSLNSVFD